jgi:oxidase EvaA
MNIERSTSREKQNNLRNVIVESAFHAKQREAAPFDLKQRKTNIYTKEIAFSDLKKWHFDTGGNLRHESGKFFSVVGVKSNNGNIQPIILQPEYGILGIISQVRNGTLQFLMQKKFEPGNPNYYQVSPTVQATKSNYTAVHKGKSVPYLDYFIDSDRSTINKGLLSEQTKRFFRKKNWNIIINLPAEEEVEVLLNFKWVTIRELLEFIKTKNTVNMNTRSIISAIQYNVTVDKISLSEANKICDDLNQGDYKSAKGRDLFVSSQKIKDTKHSLEEIELWINSKRRGNNADTEIIDLKKVTHLVRTEYRIGMSHNNEFHIIALEINSNREVSHWTQPIVEDTCTRISGFVAKQINGVLHLLLRNSFEIGSCDGSEFGPTICGMPLNYSSAKEHLSNYKFAKYFYQPKKENCYLSVIHSDEGGRFYKVENKHMIVLTDDEIDEGDDYIWATIYQIKTFINKGNYVTMEARSILSCINFFEE